MQSTSLEAEASIKPAKHTLRAQVLAYIKSRGPDGATDEEIQIALKMTGNTQRPRRKELEQADSIKMAKFQRKTSSGRNANVWIAKEFAPKPQQTQRQMF